MADSVYKGPKKGDTVRKRKLGLDVPAIPANEDLVVEGFVHAGFDKRKDSISPFWSAATPFIKIVGLKGGWYPERFVVVKEYKKPKPEPWRRIIL